MSFLCFDVNSLAVIDIMGSASKSSELLDFSTVYLHENKGVCFQNFELSRLLSNTSWDRCACFCSESLLSTTSVRSLGEKESEIHRFLLRRAHSRSPSGFLQID